MMHIDKNSYGTIALVYLIGAAVLWVMFHFCGTLWLNIFVLIFVLSFCVWQTLFFRVPERSKDGSNTVVTSVADGDVVIVEKAFEPEFLKTECLLVSIYMDFWNVHANFWPVNGKVTYYKYHPGKHLLAFKPKASEDNEHTSTCIRTADGYDIFFKQLAGTFARRIVCYSEPGLETAAGEQCGIIKFGSRVDMYLPLDADVKVAVGQKVRACETIVAELTVS